MSNSVRSREISVQKKESRKCQHLLLSCCLFFAILCVCLVTALVFIGKQYYFDEAASDTQKHRITRLSEDVIPFSYDIVLKPDLDSGNFKGSVNITLKVLRETSTILLHSKGLKIATVDLYNSSKVEVHDVADDAFNELLNITTKESLFGDYNLIISFHGSLLDRLVGFYRSQYVDEETKSKRLIATSKFEPTYARQAFPCFDEPNKKAHFKVHLLKPKDSSYIALFNMPQINETETAEGTMVDFQESVKMSTYLSAFIVSDFKATNDTITSKNGDIPLRVFATPSQLSKTEYARDTAKKVMEFYLDYFNIPYPLPKLDLVAIPDFVSGAMEHWGLVTFRETALLYDPSISSTSNKERVASVIAHELAHSWFGNLVTMNWWNDLWLNEGFANYIEYKGVHAAEPTWQMLDQFTFQDMHSVLQKDATLASHPIVQTVETPDEITAIFDEISYNKGASILRMLESSVGEEIFQQAVTNYLIKHKFGNAITQDLLDQLQVLIKDGINITEFMNTWTVQMGLPVVNIKKENGSYELTQKRFLIYEEGTDNTKPPYKWTIPITYFTSENSTPTQIWFDYNKESITIKSDANWIKLNSKQFGYYRTNYGLDNWNALSTNIMNFNIGDRSHLIEESFQLANANQLHYSVPLNLSKYLIAENDYIPWAVANNAFKSIQRYLKNSALYSNYKEFVIHLVNPAYTNYTWDDSNEEDHITKVARVTILSLACSMEHSECLDEANKKFLRWLNGEEELSQDLKGLIYKYGMIKASKDQWDKMWDRFVREGDAGEKLRLLYGLASINDINLIYRLIDLAKDETYIRNQDYFTCLGYISRNPIGTNYVWHYVRENWQSLVKRFGLNDRYLGRLIPTITKTFGTQTKLDEMKSFFKKYPNAGAGAAARVMAISTVENNIRWLKKNKEIVEKWLVENRNETKS